MLHSIELSYSVRQFGSLRVWVEGSLGCTTDFFMRQ
jgi:hypothetical protein